jgi:hypothetical protein
MGFFDSNGNKTAMATYNGQKWKMVFWNDTVLSEVDYSNNQIAVKLEARCFSDR